MTMLYEMTAALHDRVEFSLRKDESFAAQLFAAIGAMVFLIGGYLVVSQSMAGDPVTFGYLMLGFGGSFFSLGMLALGNTRHQPKRIRFDNRAACMVVSMDDDFRSTVSFPYQQIREFRCRRYAVGSYDGPSRQGAFRVSVLTQDFQVWQLGAFITEEKGQAHAEYLSKMIDLQRSADPTTPEVPASVTLERNGHVAVIRWKNSQTARLLLVLVLLYSLQNILTFIFNSAVFELETSLAPIVYMSSTLFLILIGIGVLVALLKGWNEQSRVEIGDGRLRFGLQRGTAVIPKREMDISQVRSIGVQYENMAGRTEILVVDEELFKTVESGANRMSVLSGILQGFRAWRTSFLLPASRLSVVDRMRLSQMMLMLIRAHEGNRLI